MVNMIILALSILSAFLLGSWVTYRAMQNKNPIPGAIKDMFSDPIDDIISPYEQEQKAKVVKVKV